MREKKKIIIYGLGIGYTRIKDFLENKYDVVGYSDRNDDSKEILGSSQNKFILPRDISNLEFDFICITSKKYFGEIRDMLQKIIGEEDKNKIVSVYDLFGDFRNEEIRNQWVIDQIGKIPDGKILLDAGAGEQKYRPFCSHLKYVAQDFGKFVPNETSVGLSQDILWDYTGLNITCDIVDMPLGDGAVDVVLCTEVFEHLKNPMLALKEFSRILKPGGTLILTAPICCLTHMAPYFYYNGFSEYWYKDHLRDYGFEIRDFVSNGNYFKYICQELFRAANMAKRYCEVELNVEELYTISDSMEIMMRLSEKDRGSEETLCFGKMLTAVKMGDEMR